MKRRKLLLLVAILSAIGYGYSFLSVPKVPLISPEIQLVNIKKNTINRMLVSIQKSNHTLELMKIKHNWVGTIQQTTVALQNKKVDKLLERISNISSVKVVAHEQSDWSKYLIDDQNGVKFQLYSKNGAIEQLIFSDLCEKDTSYVRMNNGQDVYQIPFCISSYFENNLNDFRNSEITKFNPENVSSFGWLDDQDLSHNYFRNEGQWNTNSEEISKKKIESFLKKIAHLQSNDFVDDIDETTLDDYFYNKLKLNGVALETPIEISCFYNKDWQKPYIIKSNLNPNTYFESDSLGLFSLLFTNILNP